MTAFRALLKALRQMSMATLFTGEVRLPVIRKSKVRENKDECGKTSTE